jgi:GNAT superfamily N-acetyltransferase
VPAAELEPLGRRAPCDACRVAEVTVRSARREDLEQLLGLYDVLAGEKRSAAPADVASAAAILAEAIEDRARRLVVAEVEAAVCGTADMLVVPNITHRGAPWAIIENVVVAREQRRRGVATRMMLHLLDAAREQGCCKAQLLSGKHRGEAHSMYRSLGFQAVAEGFKVYFDE